MADLCEGGNETAGSLKAICKNAALVEFRHKVDTKVDPECFDPLNSPRSVIAYEEQYAVDEYWYVMCPFSYVAFRFRPTRFCWSFYKG
ncbi:hypothetical protein ANN_22650 [Periplaneta americana]|uniref:Uncharacterized protein n=1 Tax=Periplaneta americana TaxID=6978 RepID=A0ABQ8S8Q5_PERAM|nr:hypothetical protein ANN_22650 [Periplaneta americana]